jgi:hypothetical protein
VVLEVTYLGVVEIHASFLEVDHAATYL